MYTCILTHTDDHDAGQYDDGQRQRLDHREEILDARRPPHARTVYKGKQTCNIYVINKSYLRDAQRLAHTDPFQCKKPVKYMQSINQKL